MLKRDIETDFLNWKNSQNHMPILLRGARQIGKTFTVRNFGSAYFEHYIEINFELHDEAKHCFRALDPNEIVKELELLTNQDVIPGKTLLFLDEIQECPRAIMALRYFKENMPELHVIAAGSLLEFVFNESDFRMPVGRVFLYHMQPLSFKEFLTAKGFLKLRGLIETVENPDEISPASHEQLLKLVKEYCVLGGMPAVFQEYEQTNSYKKAQDMQSAILNTYRSDFAKYSKGAEINYCRLLYNKAPELVGKQFKFSHVSQEAQSRALKPALEKLVQANVIHTVYATAASGLPLNALLNDKKLKLLFLDIGLMKRAGHLSLDILIADDLLLINEGKLAEQFVGQELLASQDLQTPPEIYFWARDKRSASAEVDYVINIERQILPIEVKSGSSNKMKSLRMFLEEKGVTLGVKICSEPLHQEENILTLPTYLTSEVYRLCKPGL